MERWTWLSVDGLLGLPAFIRLCNQRLRSLSQSVEELRVLLAAGGGGGGGVPGPAGPAGPAGVAGAAGAPAYVHVQAVASDTWTINHNLGYRPSVELLSDGGMEFYGDVLHVSANDVICSFLAPVSGLARLL